MRRKINLVLSFILLFLITCSQVFASGPDISYNGNDNGTDVMLQAFHWNSADEGGWYNIINNMASTIRSYYTVVWMPPPNTAPSFAKQGYLPEEWYNLNNYYGTQTELKNAISALHDIDNNVKVLADIVINHRNGMSQCPHDHWIYYSNPTMTPETNLIDGNYDTYYDGTRNTCIVCANNEHTEGSWSYDDRTYYCDDYNAAPDLTHWASDTRTKIKDWLDWLKSTSNAGFDGWRYDFIRGYSPEFLGEYNYYTDPYLSVGEFWKFEDEGLPSSARQALCDIVNASGNRTMVFDFDLKRSLNSAFGNWTFQGSELANTGENGMKGLIGWWSQAAVTFVDNHDTGWSPGGGQNHWPLPTPCDGDLISVKAAYSFILTHPGIPCVYWADWLDRDSDLRTVIETLIKIRKNNNVTRWSRVWVDKAEDGLYAAYIGDEFNEQVAIKIGNQGWSNYENWKPDSSLGLDNAFGRYYPDGHAFTVYYKNPI
jgi:alpha-amylase